jgi:hypothetical protein
VQKLAVNFIPAGDDSGSLWGGQDSDPESALFKKIKNQGHYGADPHPDAHGVGNDQGYYAATPSGILLSSRPATDAEDVAKMMEEALAKWKKLPREKRLLPQALERHPPGRFRYEDLYPKGGLVLRVNCKDLPRAEKSDDYQAYKDHWNHDYAWFTKDEAQLFLPETLAKDAEHAVPAPLVRRLARLHLTDNVRSITEPFEDSQVQKAELRAKVVSVDGDAVSLRLEGETLTSASGVWAVSQEKPSPQTRGYEARLLGRATYDVRRKAFSSFLLVAVGTRWGGTVYNGRDRDTGRAPMGVVFTLAGNSPAERVAPLMAWAYGWR